MAGPRLYWTRRGIAEWLGERLLESPATLVGIDHGFSFPLRYFEKYGLAPDWTAFLEDFQTHWPTDKEYMYVESVREGTEGAARARSGHSRWRRLAETRAGAKSVFHFDVPGTVAKSTHAGLPWLLYLRRQTRGRVHFWPFDGWEIPGRRSVVAEAYPGALEQELSAGWARSSSARRVFDCGLDAAGGRRRIARSVFFRPELFQKRERSGRNGRMDSGRAVTVAGRQRRARPITAPGVALLFFRQRRFGKQRPD